VPGSEWERFDHALFRRLRIERKLSQRDLARAVGVTTMTVKNWDHGRYSPNASVVPALCAAMGLSPSERARLGLRGFSGPSGPDDL